MRLNHTLKVWLTLAIVFLAILPACAQAPRPGNIHVTGTVTGTDGAPVAGARITQRWSYQNGRYFPVSEFLTSDAKGKFEGDLSPFRGNTSLLAIGSDGKSGAAKLFNAEELKAPVALKLEPLATVEFSVVAKELPGFREDRGLELFLLGNAEVSDNQAYLLDLNVDKQPLRVPPGAYRLLVRTNNIRYFQYRFVVEPNAPELKLGELVATASKMGQLFGKAAPEWTVTETRGVPATVTVAGYKGKWLVVEFWAHWCVPCVNGGIPRLKSFYEKHAKDRGRFEAIAVHDSSLKSLEEVDRHTAEVKQRAWGNQDLPFPILLDKEKKTFSDWGVGAIPCVLLVSPDGTLIRTDDALGYLEKQLANQN